MPRQRFCPSVDRLETKCALSGIAAAIPPQEPPLPNVPEITNPAVVTPLLELPSPDAMPQVPYAPVIIAPPDTMPTDPTLMC